VKFKDQSHRPTFTVTGLKMSLSGCGCFVRLQILFAKVVGVISHESRLVWSNVCL